MPTNRYSRLLETDLPSEPFVRTALGALEAGFREMALLALDDWLKLDITSLELFSAVASLQRPSWGMWNGLISALRNARKAINRSGTADERKHVEGAAVLEKTLALADQPVEAEIVAKLKPLGELTRSAVGTRLKLGALLAMPIALRNRIAHDTPTDGAWWTQAAEALRPLVEFHAADDLMKVPRMTKAYPSPWFLMDGEQPLSFNGIEHDFAAIYVNDAGVSKAAPGREGELLRAMAKLLGKADAKEIEFKSLLSKLAPEEIRGVMLGDYLVGRPVGEGGFATVHIGRQLSTGRKVAIKILHDGMDADAIARFHQEAAFLSRFRHPHIVDVYGFGQEIWTPPRAFSLVGEPWFDAFAKTAPVKAFIALEWIEGRTLDEIFREAVRSPQTKPDLQTLATWMAEAADAISVVHAAGLIHRDIKPHNLMITKDAAGEGQIKLMDFGIARVLKAERTLVTEAGHALGTPAYMSPEQIRASDAEGEVGPASDVYSLAATFYELITGLRLYRHDTVTVEEVKTLKTSGRRPTRPSVVVTGLPWEIETILLGGLEPEPADRYRTMDALERDLRHYLADQPIEYKQPSYARRILLVYRRNRAISNLAAVFVLLIAVGITSYIRSIRNAEKRTAAQRDIAITNEGIAHTQTALADAREKEVRIKLAELSDGNGHALMDKGDPTAALLWYTRSLPLIADAPVENRVERRRIGITLRQMPRPVRLWNYGFPQLQSVYVGALSPDGKRIATGEVWINPGGAGGLAEAHGAARVMDAATGEVIVAPIEHPKMITAISFSRDGKRFVTLSDGIARVFDAATGKLICAPLTDDAGIGLARLSFDGERLMVFSASGKRLRIIDLSKGVALYPDLLFDQQLSNGFFSDDGNKFLITEGSGTVRTNATVHVFEAGSGKSTMPPLAVPTLWSVLFSPNGKTFAVASGEGWARIYDADTSQPTTPQLAHSGTVISICFTRDGKQLATGSSDNTSRIWDTATGKAITAPMKQEESPFALGFSRDGNRLATIGYDKALRIWDARSGYQISPALRQTGEILDGIFPENAANQFTILTQSGAVTWDFARAADPGVARFDHFSEATRSTVSPDGTRIALNSSKGSVRVIDARSGALVCVLPHPMEVTEVRFSPDSRRVVTASKDAARVWDITPDPILISATTDPAAVATTGPTTAPVGNLVVKFKHDGPVNTAVFSPSGTTVLIACADKTARIFDAASGESVGEPMAHEGDVTDAEFSADGTLIATSCADHNSRVWSTTGKPLSDPLKSIGGVPMVRFSPDGKSIVAPDDGGFVRIWNWQTGQCTARMTYGSATREASFTPDGTQIVAAGFNTGAKRFDLQSPRTPSVIYQGGPFCAVARQSTDGSMLYTASFAGSRLWDQTGAPLGPVLQPLPMRDGQFTPDGRRLITVDTKIRAWDITPDERPVADLDKFARLISGRSLDARGVISLIKDEEAAKLFEELRAKYPKEFGGQLSGASNSEQAQR